MNIRTQVTPEELHAQLQNFAEKICAITEGFHGKVPSAVRLEDSIGSLDLSADLIASVYFVGTVFGEYILSVNKRDAENIFSEFSGMAGSTEASLGEALCETLNMAAGGSLKTLLTKYEKVTIASPRLFAGHIRYPGIRAKKAVIQFGEWELTLALYIDTMRLDIADSYKVTVEQLRAANQNLVNANERLQTQQMQLVHSEKMASLGVMAAGVAHEINNPLAYVLSNTEVLSQYVDAFQKLFEVYHRLTSNLALRKAKETLADLKDVQVLEKENDMEFIIQDTLNLIQESKSGLDRIRAIVGGLKQFSRVDDTGMKFVQINDELKNTLQLLAHELKYKAEVKLNLGNVPEVRCSPGEMGQVFLNLIMNAAQALPKDGGEIEVSTRDEGENILVTIADNGCGISPENLPKIFNPFFTTKPVGKGTGLGLSISHGIVEKHKGSIQVESTVGKGSRFLIRLPFLGDRGSKFEEV